MPPDTNLASEIRSYLDTLATKPKASAAIAIGLARHLNKNLFTGWPDRIRFLIETEAIVIDAALHARIETLIRRRALEEQPRRTRKRRASGSRDAIKQAKHRYDLLRLRRCGELGRVEQEFQNVISAVWAAPADCKTPFELMEALRGPRPGGALRLY